MAAVPSILSRHGAVLASVAFHGAVVAALIFELNPPPLTTPANAETPAIAVEIITMPTPEPDLVTTAAPPPPPPEPEPPEVIEEPPPLIESTVAETVAPPPPPPEIKPEPEKPKPKPVRMVPKPRPVEPAPTPPQEVVEAPAPPAPPVPAPVAKQVAKAAPAGRAGPPPDYLTLLHRALERNKDYPSAARQRRQQGRAMLRFAIDRDGNVLNYKIEKSSGYEILDREVVAMIKRASPLPPMPSDMMGDRLEVVVPIPFVLR